MRVELKVLLVIAAVVVATALMGCSKATAEKPKADPHVPVTVARVETVSLDRSLPIVGTLYAKDEATVAAQVEGQVEKTRVDFGDRLTQGQEIAAIDTTSYEAQTNQAAANLARAKATALNAEQSLQRVRDLQKEKISSASELDQAIAAAEQARADVKAAEAAEVIAKLNLERSHVRAPFDSAVAERIASAGDYMKIGSPLFRVVNDRVLKFIFQVPERNASYVKKGLPVRFGVDNYPGEVFTGSVYLISPAVMTSSRAFGVGALVTNTDFRLKANTFARGTLVLEGDVPTPMIPLDAVVSFAGVTKVFVVENNVARARQVNVGRINNGKQEILEGLQAGETVVVTGQSRLSEGTPVTIQTLNAKADAAPQENDSRTGR
jgi:membrane fusion protein (multidrug efflux system)